MDTIELRKKAHDLLPVIRIGKFGITEGIILEIKNQLRKKKLIKIKLLHAFVHEHDRKATAEQLAAKTGAVLVDVTGFTIVLYRK